MNLSNRIGVARDLMKNIYKAAAGIITGDLQRLEASEKLRRLKVCETCEHFNAEIMQCRICKCKGRMMNLKASVNVWTCPLDKWEEANIDAPYGYCERCKGIVTEIEAHPETNRYNVAICINGHRRNVKNV